MRLPLELADDIIDEVFDTLSTWAGSQRACSTRTLSSLALVSHPFRQRTNMHRFSNISFHNDSSTLSRVHGFLALLQSDTWVRGVRGDHAGIARHVRRLHLSLGDRNKRSASQRIERISLHPALEDGSYARIMNSLFRGTITYSPTTGLSYTLALSTSYVIPSINWNLLDDRFIFALKALRNSNLTSLELTRIINVPYTFFSAFGLACLRLENVMFSFTNLSEMSSFKPMQYLEALELHKSYFFTQPDILDLLPTGAFPALKRLSLRASSEVSLILPDRWISKHLEGLEVISIHVYDENTYVDSGPIPRFTTAPRKLPHLKKAIVYVDLDSEKYGRFTPGEHLGQMVGKICLGVPPCDLEIFFHGDCAQPLDQIRNGPATLFARFNYHIVDKCLHYCSKKSFKTITIHFDIDIIHNRNVSFDYFDELKFGEDLQAFVGKSFPLMNENSSGREVLKTSGAELRVRPRGGDIWNISLVTVYSISA